MLRPEQAHARLQEVHDERGAAKRLAAVTKLPKPLAAAGRWVLGCDEEDEPISYGQLCDSNDEAPLKAWDAFSARDRRKLFDTLFPKIGSHVDAGWRLFPRLPYQTGVARKSFRAPSEPGLTRAARLDWLCSLVHPTQGLDQDLGWLAAWAPHLTSFYAADALGVLFAAAIDQGDREGEAVFQILCDSARGEHEIGGMGRHVSRALLVAQRPDGWELMEKMLLAAQRQEGLRQVILESVDEAHPEAFRRMLRLILEHDLARFSAVVRALNVWFGFQWDSASVKVVNDTLAQVQRFLEDEESRIKALRSDDGNALYLALWATAFEDAVATLEPAAALLKDGSVERRFVGVHFLGQLQLPAANAVLVHAVEDEDLRVALTAWRVADREAPELFESTKRLLARLPPKKTTLEALVWPWTAASADPEQVANTLVDCLGERAPTCFLPYLPRMDGTGRAWAVVRLAEQKKWDRATRVTLFRLVGDTASWVRQKAAEALAHCTATEPEAQALEAYLRRKPADLRRAVLAVLLNQKDAGALASAERLLALSDPNQRRGGLELLRQLAEAKRSPGLCRRLAASYRANRKGLSNEEELQITAILDTGRTVYTLEDALGLLNPADRTKPVAPKNRQAAFLTPAALACLQALDEVIDAQRETTVTIETYEGTEQELLGNLNAWSFPRPRPDVSLAKDVDRLPLRETWESWFQHRPKEQRDQDGLELLRAHAWCDIEERAWNQQRKAWGESVTRFANGRKPAKLRYRHTVEQVLAWLLRLHPPEGAVPFLLDAVETSFALVPENVLTRKIDPQKWEDCQKDWREAEDCPYRAWLGQARSFRNFCPAEWSPDHHNRLYQLLRWMDEPVAGVHRSRPDLGELVAAFRADGATEADVLDHLLGPREESHYSQDFDALRRLTGRKPAEEFEQCPRLRELVDDCRRRILEIERDRGDTPTAASAPATALRSLFGVATLLRLLHALGRSDFYRGYDTSGAKPAVLSHLIEVTYPAGSDTQESFARNVKQAGLAERRLIELAFHAPQWVEHVEFTLGWPGFAEGVWWFIAHTRYGDPGDDREAWEKRIGERTPLTPEDLQEGAVDVEWFRRVYAAVGARRWGHLRDASKYACHAQGHKQALLLSDVLLGEARKADLVTRIRQKQRRESVRLLGLLPLAKGKERPKDVLDRYQVLQEYHAYARKLSAMTKESALRACQIGMDNLARTAGYADPLRFAWAMEAEAVSDLGRGPVKVSASGVDVVLEIDDRGQPELTVSRQGKLLQSIPADAKKNAKVAALAGRKTALKKQASRIRLSLEQSMCRGDTFTAAELKHLFAHPVLKPQLERLILVGEGIAGYPVAGGQGLRDHTGRVEPIKKEERLRIAHPHDLLSTREWDEWQRDCFAAERMQPFKQVFRELYVLTGQERADVTISRRYAGQQINPRQATSLWGSRGWSVNQEDGVRRTFHDAGLSAWVTFAAGTFTPAEVEGWTLEGVRFCKRGAWEPLELAGIPPRIFSEVMRDLDLVVSVAHRGGVDPEASASTLAMRAALLRQTCTLLQLDNVRIKDAHVLVAGQLSDYNVHLGSAVVHRQPGGHLCIVPVHAQHRGRLFLPFADDDPKTAEVLSKVLLLARDSEIRDPNILDQIRAGG